MVKQCPDATYYVAFSKRNNGKTFDMLCRCVENYFTKGWQGAYLRRFYENFKGSRGDNLFSGLIREGKITKYSKGEWTGVYHAGNKWYFTKQEIVKKKNGEEETKRVICKEPFMYGFAIDQMESDKSAEYDRIHEIYFDEFLTRTFYITDEFLLFQNVCSTIIRQKKDVKIFMAGNTVSKIACPYFREMGLDRVKKQEQGTIDVYQYGDSLLQVAVEYCANHKESKENEKYFAFGNPRLKMITDGEWEIAAHPHLKHSYAPKDLLFTFYIYFDDEYLCGKIIIYGGYPVLFVEPKTTPLKKPDIDLIYSDQWDARPNWRRSIYHDNLQVSRRILSFVADGKTYFADNTTGEIWDAYLKWSRQNM